MKKVKVFEIKRINCSVYEDNYSMGESGCVHDWSVDISKRYTKYKDFLKRISIETEHQVWGLKDHATPNSFPLNYQIFPCYFYAGDVAEEIKQGRHYDEFRTNVLCAYDGREYSKATTEQIKVWKKGDMRLFQMYINFDVDVFWYHKSSYQSVWDEDSHDADLKLWEKQITLNDVG